MKIYLITNGVSGKIYIGQTRQPLEKYLYNQGWRARQGLTKKTALYSAIRKYGIENFQIQCLRVCFSNEEMNLWEKIYISLLCSQSKVIGYNIASGGKGNPGRPAWNKGKKNPYSKETLERMSESQKKRMGRDGNPMKGRTLTFEQCKKMSNTFKQLGIRPSVEACRLGGKARHN